MSSKNIKTIIIVVVFLLLGFGVYKFFTNEDANTSLNITEKTWIENHKNELQNISIFSDMPILSYDGKGIIFDFLDALEKNTGLEFNRVSYTLDKKDDTKYIFNKKSAIEKKDILLYTDNFVIVTKNNVKYNSLKEIKGLNVGVTNSDLDNANKYLLGSDVSFKSFASYELLFTELSDDNSSIDAIIVPKTECLDDILEGNYTIAYNMNEYKNYFVLSLGDTNKLNSILTKYYKKWASQNYDNSYNAFLVNDYFQFSNKTEQEKTKFKSKEYTYGFISNAPYDLSVDSKLFGINSSLISSFVNLSKIKIKYKEYNSYSELVEAFNANKIDFYMNASNITDFKLDYFDTYEAINNNIVVLSKYTNNITVNSLNSLGEYDVVALKDSKIASTLKDYGIKARLYDNMEDLIRNSDNNLLVIDSNNFNYYKATKLKNYKVDYSMDYAGYAYTVRDIKDNKAFEQFFKFYISFELMNKLANTGVSNLINIDMKTIILPKIGIGLLVVLIIIFIGFLVYRFNPKSIKKRRNTLTKEDKLKYIDVLTSLKNRNYLNDSIEKWDDGEIYPQTIIMIDLNNVAYINDNYGHAEGDKIIKDAANILIKNQLDNTEIIRTNGNEFLIYMVSYDEKQVVSYIRKLNKEFKDLEHGFGAAIGYSVINDAIKTIDDAVNEATIDMRNNKEEDKN